jgi:uncharacterized protein (UPF0333 family)
MKKYKILILIIVLILAGVTTPFISSNLQGLKFKNIKVTKEINQASLKNNRDYSKITPSYKDEKNDLIQIWGTEIEPTMTDIYCPTVTDNYLKKFTDQDLNIIKKKLNDTNVYFIVTGKYNEETSIIKNGINLTEKWLELSENYFGEYPCTDLIVKTYLKESNSTGPGFATVLADEIGEGFNYYWLLWHELTHSFFGTHSTQSLWLREGPSHVLPLIMIEETCNDKSWDFSDWNTAKNNCAYYLETESVQNSFAYPGKKEKEFYNSKNACELSEPNGTDGNYQNNAAWGKIFLLDLSINTDKDTVIKTLNTIYKKYRYTNLSKITDEDFYKAFTYFAKGKYGKNSEKYKTIEILLKTKLCQ